MLRSMTGFGAASQEGNGIRVSVEVKSVNGRFLKSNIKLPTSMTGYQSSLEGLIREYVTRGSVTMTVFVEETADEAKVSVNEELALAYHSVFERLGITGQNIAQLPGVIDPKRSLELNEEQWSRVQETASKALEELVAMRTFEGTKLKEVLAEICGAIGSIRMAIGELAPTAVTHYHAKLQERVEALLQGSGVAVEPQAIAREVALFADRCDVREELDRIEAHLQQVEERLADGREVGRSLDFLAQELLRESNTTGSKSGSIEISKLVIELKAEIERFKEQVANIE